jgi:superfamily II DNA or RNA helicase
LSIALRPYQVDAIAAARAKLREGAKSVLLVCPTGGGKTVIASDIIRSAAGKGSRVVFLAHRRELINQTADKLNRFGVRYGVIMPGFPRALHQAVQVASVQTLARHPELLSRVDLIFFDEAHHATAESYQEPLKWWPNAKVVGLTATPWRMDGRGLADIFASHVVARTPRQLRDDGYLCAVGGWEYEAIDTSGARVQRGDFVPSDLAQAATQGRVVGDIVAEWLAHAAGARTVLFACNVEHSCLMRDEFLRAGVPTEHVDGEMPARERDAILERLRAGITRVVTNCNVLTEGWDCPEAEVCILARPTLSLALALQMIGRVLRPAPGKERARIHDHAGVLAAHGHPYADRDYSPLASTRLSRKEAEEHAKRQRRCNGCKSVAPRWPCDSCGWMPVPETLQIEMEAEARRKTIGADPNAEAVPAKDFDERERRAVWKKRFARDELRQRAFFSRAVERWTAKYDGDRARGVKKAVRVFEWFSGGLARVPADWVAEERGARAEACG